MFEVLVASKPRAVRTLPQTVAAVVVHLAILAVVLRVTMLIAVPAASIGGAAPRSPLPPGAAVHIGGPVFDHSPDYYLLGQRYTRWYLSGHADSLVRAMDPATAIRLGGYAEIKRDIEAELLRMGPELKLVAERFDVDSGIASFEHEATFRWTGDDRVVIRWRFGPDGRIMDMSEIRGKR